MERAKAYLQSDFREESRDVDTARGKVNEYHYQVKFSQDNIPRIENALLTEIVIGDGDETLRWDMGCFKGATDSAALRKAFDIVVDHYSEPPSEYPEEKVLGYPVEFERRRYGRQFYCWAYIYIPGVKRPVSLGDPYPASRWKRTVLENAVRHVLEYIGIASAEHKAI